jgi:hypothetical protein
MNRILSRGLLGLSLALAGTPTAATIPGNIEQRAREGLLHVCVDGEPGDDGYIVCDEQVGDSQSEYTGGECAAAGLAAICSIDFVPKARVKAKLLLVADSIKLDSNGVDQGAGAVIQLEFKLKGEKHLLVEVFDTTTLGNWNAIDPEALVFNAGIEFTNEGETAYQFANDNLTDLGITLREMANAALEADLTGTVPVLTDIVRQENKLESDHADPGDPIGSASRWKAVIEFVRVRP